MSDCLFCKIIAGEIPSTKVYEDDTLLAFRDIAPQAPSHILIIPKKHMDSLDDTCAENLPDVAACLLAIPQIAAAEGLAKGYRIITNIGDEGGQVVHHLHFHLVGGRQLSNKLD